MTPYQEPELGKQKGKPITISPKGPVYEAILRKRITKKEDIRGNFEIPCNIGGQKGINALPLVHLPFGIAEDVLAEVAEHVYLVDFVILDIKENKKRPFILGTPFLTTAKAVIKFDKDTITLRSGKSKISFHRIPESSCKIEKGVKNDIEPIAPVMTVNRLVLEWEERIKLHLEKEMKFNQWRSNNFKNSLAKAILWNRIGDFMHQHADNFNSFINNSSLIGLPLGGRLFAWMNKAGTKLSKPDRFLISKEAAEALPNLLRDSFDEVIKTELPKLEEHKFGRKLLSHEKLRLLKARIKKWYPETKTSYRVTKHDNL
ncbi:reverse transcriptase domain-containing protein [Tanacetum coccineum]